MNQEEGGREERRAAISGILFYFLNPFLRRILSSFAYFLHISAPILQGFHSMSGVLVSNALYFPIVLFYFIFLFLFVYSFFFPIHSVMYLPFLRHGLFYLAVSNSLANCP